MLYFLRQIRFSRDPKWTKNGPESENVNKTLATDGKITSKGNGRQKTARKDCFFGLSPPKGAKYLLFSA
jgi:hypothetical protein